MEKSKDYAVGDPRRILAVGEEIRGPQWVRSHTENPEKILRIPRALAEGGWIALILTEWGAGRYFNLRGASEGARVPYYVGAFYLEPMYERRIVRGNFLFDIVKEPRRLLPVHPVWFSHIEFRFNAGFKGVDALTEEEVASTRSTIEALHAETSEERNGRTKLLWSLSTKGEKHR